MILRAFTCFKDAEGAVVPSKEWDRQQVMWERQQEQKEAAAVAEEQTGYANEGSVVSETI